MGKSHRFWDTQTSQNKPKLIKMTPNWSKLTTIHENGLKVHCFLPQVYGPGTVKIEQKHPKTPQTCVLVVVKRSKMSIFGVGGRGFSFLRRTFLKMGRFVFLFWAEPHFHRPVFGQKWKNVKKMTKKRPFFGQFLPFFEKISSHSACAQKHEKTPQKSLFFQKHKSKGRNSKIEVEKMVKKWPKNGQKTSKSVIFWRVFEVRGLGFDGFFQFSQFLGKLFRAVLGKKGVSKTENFQKNVIFFSVFGKMAKNWPSGKIWKKVKNSLFQNLFGSRSFWEKEGRKNVFFFFILLKNEEKVCVCGGGRNFHFFQKVKNDFSEKHVRQKNQFTLWNTQNRKIVCAKLTSKCQRAVSGMIFFVLKKNSKKCAYFFDTNHLLALKLILHKKNTL